MQLGCFVAANLHVEMGKTVVQPIKSKHVGILQLGGVLLPALCGEHNFWKTHPKQTNQNSVALFRPPTVPT